MKARYRIAEAAEMLSVSESKVENLLRSGALRAHQDTAGGDRYISQRAIDEYILWREEQGCVGRRKAG